MSLRQRLNVHLRRLRRYRRALGIQKGLKAYARLLLLEKFDRNERLVQIEVPGYRYPVFLRTHTSDVEVFEQFFVNRVFEFPLPASARFILDCGANVGYSAIHFAHRYPEAKIISVEPEISNFEILKRNVDAYPNITAIQAGIWNKPGRLKIINYGIALWGIQVAESEEQDSETMPAITIEELLTRSPTGRIDILKMDIEGAELEVFSTGYESWLGVTDVMIIELHDRIRTGCSKSVYAATSKDNFNQWQDGEHVCLIRYQ
jgi:FkbM family methyltransferase